MSVINLLSSQLIVREREKQEFGQHEHKPPLDERLAIQECNTAPPMLDSSDFDLC